MPSNKKSKSGKGKELATTPEKVGAGVKMGRFDVLVTPSPMPSPAKGELEQDWDLEGLEELDLEGSTKERRRKRKGRSLSRHWWGGEIMRGLLVD